MPLQLQVPAIERALRSMGLGASSAAHARSSLLLGCHIVFVRCPLTRLTADGNFLSSHDWWQQQQQLWEPWKLGCQQQRRQHQQPWEQASQQQQPLGRAGQQQQQQGVEGGDVLGDDGEPLLAGCRRLVGLAEECLRRGQESQLQSLKTQVRYLCGSGWCTF